jgi:uncharacterized membrane protein YphA (DoxX/SURF4 family)
MSARIAQAARFVRAALPYTWPVRAGLGVMFLFSSYPKLRDLAGFSLVVQQYGILPDPLVTPFAYALPFGEFLLGVMLLVGLFTRLAAFGGAGLMVVFIIAISYNLAIGNSPECGCFEVGGQSGDVLGWPLLLRDIGLLALLGLTFFDSARWFSVDRWLKGTDASGETTKERG